MTIRLWAAIHAADAPDSRPPLYWTRAEAERHAADYAPGVVRIVELGDVVAERERCAVLCDSVKEGSERLWDAWSDPHAIRRAHGAADCAAAIRAQELAK